MTKIGRPTKLTKELQATVCEALRMGLYIETACDLAGITKETYYQWLKKAKAEQDVEDSDFVAFSDAVKAAQASAEKGFLRHIVLDPSWQSKAWILERKFRQRWGQNLPLGEAEEDKILPFPED